MTNFIITGGLGFIGRHCVQALVDAGHDVTVIGRTKPMSDMAASIRWIECDLIGQNQISTALFDGAYDTLIHLAWETRHGYFWTAPENELWLEASRALMTNFAAQGGKRIVSAGTCIEYDPPKQGPCIAGKTPIAPVHAYGIAKHEFHQNLEAFAKVHGLDYAWGRVFFPTGPGEHAERLVSGTIGSLLQNKLAQCTSGRQIRDFLDVRDCGAAFAKLALNDFTGAVNICSGQPVTIAELVSQIGQILDRPDLIELGVLPDRENEALNIWGDNGPLLNEIGFEPQFSLQLSLSDSIDWWRQSLYAQD